MGSLTYHMRKYLNPFLLTIAILFGALQTWVNRNGINPDGVSYLDMGDAYFRGDWHTAINAMWSPLYSWLLGGAMLLIKPTLFWEYPVAHLVNFFIYLGSLICFRFFLAEIIHTQKSLPTRAAIGRLILPESAWLVIGYLLFIWSSFVLIRPHPLVPDMCVAALVYLAAGLVLRIWRTNGNQLFAFALLGIVLGFGYLAKAPMLLLSPVFLVVAAILVGNFRKTWPRLLLVLSCFVIAIAPFIVVLSISKGRVTFGDSGKLNYAWYVNRGVSYRHWQGENSNQGVPIHPTRKVFEVPAIYEFGTPLKVTYPVWYDPSYWYEGVNIHLMPAEQLRVAARNILFYFSLFSLNGMFLLMGLIVLFYLSSDRWLLAKSILRQWFLLIPPMAALAMYSLIHVEGRYVAPFIVMTFIGVIGGINSQTFRKRSLIVPIIFATLLLSIGVPTLQLFISTIRDLVKGESGQTDYSRVADALRNMGVQPGDRVASLSHGDTYGQWARLAKVRIVSEIYEERDKDFFWAADPSIKQRVIDVFRKTGAKLIVAKSPPQSALTSDWQQLDSTDMYVYFLSKN